MNPAVSLGVFLVDRKFKIVDLAGFAVSQLCGGLVAAAMLKVHWREAHSRFSVFTDRYRSNARDFE